MVTTEPKPTFKVALILDSDAMLAERAQYYKTISTIITTHDLNRQREIVGNEELLDPQIKYKIGYWDLQTHQVLQQREDCNANRLAFYEFKRSIHEWFNTQRKEPE